MEKILTRSKEFSKYSDLKYIDAIEGTIKFDGNLSQYKNMICMFDKLTIDEYIPEIALLLKNEEISEAITKLRYLSEAANVNELRRFCKVCDNLIEVLEGYEQKIKTDFETIDCFKYFLDEVIFLKQEIENFIEKPSSFEQINRIVLQMKRSNEGKKLFNTEDDFGSPLQENKVFDEKKLILGNNEAKEIKLPDSMMERNYVNDFNDGNDHKKKGIFVPIVSFSQTKTIKKEKEEKCVLI